MVKTDLSKCRKYTSEPHGELHLVSSQCRKRQRRFRYLNEVKAFMPLIRVVPRVKLVPYRGRVFLFYNRISQKAEMERVRAEFGTESRRLVRAELNRHGSTLRSCSVNSVWKVASTGHTSAR